MQSFLSAYFRAYDTSTFLAQIARGYVKTACTPASFGPFPNVRGRVQFHIRGTAAFGERFTALGDAGTVRIAVREGGRLVIGDHVAMNFGVSIEVWHEVRIGSRVMMAPNVSIIDDNRHELEPGAVLHRGPIVIEDNVWLAANVVILPGVRIGAGSVIGGNSVVSRDIPANSFAGGTPARVIKTLNVPEGWSHRFGFERNVPAPGLLASLRRTFSGDPNAEIAGAEQAGRDHEASASGGPARLQRALAG